MNRGIRRPHTSKSFDMPYGVVQIIPVEAFDNPDYGLSREARSERLADLYSDELIPKPSGVAGWPIVQTAIRRGDLYVIETAMPNFKATLSFQPGKTDVGDYEIHPGPRVPTEKGRTVKVMLVPVDQSDHRVSMLAPYAERFAVVTVAAERPHARKIWLVGLDGIKIADDTEEAGDGDA